ncbi:putative membrane-associated ring finger [Danaus plexippus plexippus]|uniref:Membrane-associated ring finger n=1 Tax=Danaus plexippus plexippus TaxID=278856 RepID=A0A212FEJ7_DANPL|nr:putative membrane-associated ring finger [Danaus plexippus plexippus]
MSASSCSSLHMSNNGNTQRERDLRSTAQQTEISCRYSPGIGSPVNITDSEEQRQLRACIADSLTFSSPASSLLQPNRRSVSILGSVCALLLNKQGSGPKELSESGSRSDNICRICFGGASGERLVKPCSCRGTIAAVHRSCLERWLLQAATSYCELCRHHYVVTRSHKHQVVSCRSSGGQYVVLCSGDVGRWSWARSVMEWARSGRGAALAADAWRGAALGAASVLGTANGPRAARL